MITITPYKGIDNITFTMTFSEVCNFLKSNKITYTTETWPNKGCSPEVPWNIIRIGTEISIFFANDKMFKIYLENNFEGALENGISLGMSIKDACKIDPSISYDDWEEIYTSEQGYWLEDDIESEKIISITVFIKELENEDLFFRYEWLES